VRLPQASSFLGISRQTVYRLIEKGDLAAKRVSYHESWISKESLQAFAASREAAERFTPRQHSIIIGSLLGDGYLTKPKYGQSALAKGQCAAHHDYLLWHQQEFPGSTITARKTRLGEKVHAGFAVRVPANPRLTELRAKWYPEGVKVVPRDLELDSLALAVWYFDDGTNSLKGRTASFHTEGFSLDDVEFLASVVVRFGIEAYPRHVKNGNHKLCVRSRSWETLLALVKPYMLWDCFRHKVAYRLPGQSVLSEAEKEAILTEHNRGCDIGCIAKKVKRGRSTISSFLRKELGATLALNNTSGIRGVYWDKRCRLWKAMYKHKGVKYNVGNYKTRDRAEQALIAHKQRTQASVLSPEQYCL